MNADYYGSTGKKVADFSLGFMGTLLWTALLLMFSAVGTARPLPTALTSYLIPAIGWVSALAWLIGIGLFFRTGRRFIAIGMLCTLLVPLLALGACFVILGGKHW